MPLELIKYNPNGRTYREMEGGLPTGRKVYKGRGGNGEKNVDLGGGDFAPYVWDEPSQSIRYGGLSCEFYPAGYQVVREYGSSETLIDEQKFSVQYFREQGSKWIDLDLHQIGLTVDDTNEDYCIVTRNLSDGLGNTLNIDFLFRPREKVRLTFRLHVVDADQYRIRFQNTGIAGEVTEVPLIDRVTQDNLGIHRLVFENIKFLWDADEISIHEGYVIEDQAGGKKLDFFLGDFDLPADGNITISPTTWGPTTTSNDCLEYDDTTYFDDSSGDLFIGEYNLEEMDIGWIFSNVAVPAGSTCGIGCKITGTAGGFGGFAGAGGNGLLEVEDSRAPDDYDQTHRPSQRSYHAGTVVDWDTSTASGTFDSPELNTLAQQRFDDDHVAGDGMAFRWREDQSTNGDWQSVVPDDAELTLVYTEAAGETFYQGVGGYAMAMVGTLNKKITPVTAMGGHAMNIAGVLNKKTTPVTAMGGHSMSIAGTLNKKTTPVTAMGGHAMSIVGSLTKAILVTQDTGGHAMTITGALTTVVTFVRSVGSHAMTIVGTLLKKTSMGVGGHSMSIAGILSKKTSKDVGGGSVTSIGTLDATILFVQAVGGASMSIIGSLATQFIAGTGVVAKFIRRRKTFYKQ